MRLIQSACFVLPLFASTASAHAQNRSGPAVVPLYSIDWHSVSVGPQTGITSGTLLNPAGGSSTLGPLSSPVGGPPAFGLMPSCSGAPGGTPCPVDIDAISVGTGGGLGSSGGIGPGLLHYSVDPFATGTVAFPGQPGLAEETLAMDAAADLMTSLSTIPAGPLAPGIPISQRGSTDGDGLRSLSGFTYPGLGLIEPCPPVVGNPAYAGDNLDAVAFPNTFVPSVNFYFSLEGSILDPLTGVAAAGSAVANGYQGADVLYSAGAGPISMYASANSIGLDLVQGPGSDDLDALEVHDFANGFWDGVYTPPLVMHGWENGLTDMILFSVRRGSAVIGQPDSLLGLPIQEGDILMPPLPGGLSPYPGIYIAGERLGLASLRSGTAAGNHSDDLDALGFAEAPLNDCNLDGFDDIVRIGNGNDPDGDGNGVPDDCQLWSICGPANNNSTGLPTRLSGTLSMGSGSGLHLEANQGPPNQFGYFLVGTGITLPGITIGQGRLCLAIQAPNGIGRYNVMGSSMNSIGFFNASGILQNLAGTSATGSGFDVPGTLPNFAGTISAGSHWHFQLWHRDLGGQSNFSDALRMSF